MDIFKNLIGCELHTIFCKNGLFTFGNNSFSGSGSSIWSFFDKLMNHNQYTLFEFNVEFDNIGNEIYELHSELKSSIKNVDREYPIHINALLDSFFVVKSIETYSHTHQNESTIKPHIVVFKDSQSNFFVLQADVYSYDIVFNNQDWLGNIILQQKENQLQRHIYE